MASQVEIIGLLKLLVTAYPRFELTKDTTALYVEMLADVDGALLSAAAHQHIAESEWFPTVAALRNKAIELYRLSSGKQDWSAAWGKVIDAANKLGYEEVMRRGIEQVFPDPTTQEVVHQLRFREICYADLDSLNTLRAQFRDMYQSASNRAANEIKMVPQVRELMMHLADQFDMNKRLTEGKHEQ